jgi:hypothetical protein
MKFYDLKTLEGVEVKPHHFDFGTRWRLVVSLTPRPLYPRGKSTTY